MDNQEGYIKEKVTINLVWANIFAVLVLIGSAVLFGALYYLVWRARTGLFWSFEPLFGNPLVGLFVFLVVLIGGIIVHELIHGFVFAAFAKDGFKSVKFGILREMLTPYCHCKEPLRLKHYVLAALMPTILLGIVPAALAVVIGNLPLLIFGVFLISGGGGDILLVYAMRNERKGTLIEDLPSECGFYAYRLVEK